MGNLTPLSIRMKQAIDWLKHNQGLLQRDIAEKMGITTVSFSRGLSRINVKEDYDFVISFNRASNNVFSIDWLLKGEGNMLQGTELPQEATKIVEMNNGKDEIIKSLLSQNAALLSTINRLADELAGIKEEIKRLRVYSSVRTYSVPSDDVKATLNDPKEAY